MMNDEHIILLNQDDHAWYWYLFSKDPLFSQMKEEQIPSLINQAVESSAKEAYRIICDYQTNDLEKIYSLMNIKLIEDTNGSGFGILYFSMFEPDNTVRIFTEQVENVKKVISSFFGEDILSPGLVRPLLLAHELYHVCENRNKQLFTESYRHLLWQFGPISHRSRVIALSEIGATAFAKTISEVTFNPSILNYALLLSSNPQSAKRLYERVIKFSPTIT